MPLTQNPEHERGKKSGLGFSRSGIAHVIFGVKKVVVLLWVRDITSKKKKGSAATVVPGHFSKPKST